MSQKTELEKILLNAKVQIDDIFSNLAKICVSMRNNLEECNKKNVELKNELSTKKEVPEVSTKS